MANMSKVQGVHLKPTVVEDEAQAADVALDGLRRRGILARNDQGQLVVCSRKTAKKYGWAVEGNFQAAPAKEPKTKKAERLAKLNEATTAKEQWSKIAAKTKSKKAVASLEDILG